MYIDTIDYLKMVGPALQNHNPAAAYYTYNSLHPSSDENNSRQMRNLGTYLYPTYTGYYGNPCDTDSCYSINGINTSRASQVGNYYGSNCYTIFPKPNVVTKISRVNSSTTINSQTTIVTGSGGASASSSSYASSGYGAGGASSSTAKYNIAVIDYCDDSQADIDLDGDDVADMAHGNVVAHLIDANVKNANVKTFDITQNSKYSVNQRLVMSLQEVLASLQENPNSYDALNLSLSSRITYADLSKALGVTINNDNAFMYQDAIRNWLLTKGANNGYSTTAKVVQLLERISGYGVDVYIAGANVNDSTDDELNLYSIANRTTTVGANVANGGKASFSFNNSLIDTWALGEIEVKKVKSSSGTLLGYDLNNDGMADIEGTYTSGGANLSNPFLKGTSFATPYKLSRSLA